MHAVDAQESKVLSVAGEAMTSERQYLSDDEQQRLVSGLIAVLVGLEGGGHEHHGVESRVTFCHLLFHSFSSGHIDAVKKSRTSADGLMS